MHLHYKSSLLKCLSGARNINQRLRRGLQTPFSSRASFSLCLSLSHTLFCSLLLSVACSTRLVFCRVPFLCVLSTNDAFSSASSWNHICPIPAGTPTPMGPQRVSDYVKGDGADSTRSPPAWACIELFFRNFSMINSLGCLFAFSSVFASASLTLISAGN